MKRMLLVIFSVVLMLGACATKSLNSQLQTAYDTTTAYVAYVTQKHRRGGMTDQQAIIASSRAKTIRDQLDMASEALVRCHGTEPVARACGDYMGLLQTVQPALLEFEQELKGAKP